MFLFWTFDGYEHVCILQYMSLMAELGEGPPPPKSQTQPTQAVQSFRPSFSQPPPNPMVNFVHDKLL